MRICSRCQTDTGDFPYTTGWCRSCRKEYSRIWRSNRKKCPPKGEVKGNWRKAEKDFDLPPITMCYLTPIGDTNYAKGGMLCGFDKTQMYYIGTRAKAEDREDQFFCPRCRETVFVPRSIYPRLRIWADSPESVLQSCGAGDSVSRNSHIHGGSIR